MNIVFFVAGVLLFITGCLANEENKVPFFVNSAIFFSLAGLMYFL